MTVRAALAGAFAIVALLAVAPSASADFTPEQEAELQRAVDEYAPQIGYPGIVAGVWQAGVGGYVATTGVSNLETGRPMGAGLHHRIGSVTKTMTATLVLQLVNRGRLHLQDPVSEYVRRVPFGDRITIRMLLNHTSGIHDFTFWEFRKFLGQPHRNWRPPQLIRRAVRAPRYCPPGECWVYSNTNYLLLGTIVREITHQRLRALYERRIWDRLGMDDTSFRPRRPTPKPAVHGYLGSAEGLKDITDWNFSWAWSAGGVSSTLADLRRWGPALATGRGILNARMQRKRLRTVSVPDAPGDGYGLGILKAPGGPLGELYGHDGETPGYDSIVLHSPSAKLTVVALGNTSAGTDPVRPTPLSDEELVDLVPQLLKIVITP